MLALKKKAAAAAAAAAAPAGESTSAAAGGAGSGGGSVSIIEGKLTAFVLVILPSAECRQMPSRYAFAAGAAVLTDSFATTLFILRVPLYFGLQVTLLQL